MGTDTIILVSCLAMLFAWLWTKVIDSDYSSLWGCLLVLGLTVFGVKSCAESDTWKAGEASRAAADAADRVPRLISEADGCKVYAFKGGDRWHYFTRCPNSQTSTDTQYGVRSGKVTRTETETITTKTP